VTVAKLSYGAMRLAPRSFYRDRMTPARPVIIIGSLVAAALALALLPPIAQDPAYHLFADRRGWLGIPNLLDVASNAGFIVVGSIGLGHLWTSRQVGARLPHAVFFMGVALTGVGSAYYHLAPDTARLFWDRLPMTVAFVGLVTVAVSERVDARLAIRLLSPLMWVGTGSVLLWRVSELRGAGDLRAYAFVQFGALLVVILLAALYPAPTRHRDYLFGVVAVYVVAKLLEHFDAEVLAATGAISGHSLKHLAAALAPALVLRALSNEPMAPAPLRPITYQESQVSPESRHG
jgi:hypothetical protein